MQEFYINRGSVNPVLRMELIDDGRYDFRKSYIYNNLIQDSVVTFSMKNEDNGKLAISKAPARIMLSEEGGCEDKYVLQYDWKPRDVKEKGRFNAWFEIRFNGNIKEEGIEYPTGNMIVPIREELSVVIK